MSYDFELFTSRKHVLDPPLTSAKMNIRIDGPDRVEEEDLPDSYLPILGKKRILFRIHLEGDLTQSDETGLNNWLGTIVAETKGVLIDLQTDQFETPTKSGHLQAQDVQPDEIGWMCFIFEDGEKFYQSGFEELLREVSVLMPEAAPARFGRYEPLQGRIEGSDFSELISSFKSDTDVFMKSKTPFGHIFLSVPCKKTFERYHPQHFIRRQFLLGEISFEIRPKLFANPEGFERLKKLFEKLCLLLDVVYAEIGQTDLGGSWVWYGLPDTQAHTICIGAAYQSAWPDFLTTGCRIGDHHHVVATDRFGNRPPRPPKELVAPGQKNPRGKPEYATVFPFEYEFDFNKYIW